MIVCSCTSLSCREVRAATQEAMCEDVQSSVSPGRVFRMCGRSVCCGACSRLVNQTIADHAATLRAELELTP